MTYKFGKKVRRYTVRGVSAYVLVGFVLGLSASSVLTHDERPTVSALNRGIWSSAIKWHEGDNEAGEVESSLATVGVRDNGINRGQLVLDSRVDCSVSANRNFGSVHTSYLRKLAEYDQVCPGAISATSFFVETPASAEEGSRSAGWIASVLREYESVGVQPIVFMEPMSNGVKLDASLYRAGAYDQGLDSLFYGLKNAGISEGMMGTWVYWPEANIPVWSSVDPEDFSSNVTRTVRIQKKYFPKSKSAILLESKTYPSVSSWSGSAYKSLAPYVQTIPPGLIDSVGLQGFAWPPTERGGTPQLRADEFLRTDLAIEIASLLGVKDIWFNTGVFYESYIVNRNVPFRLSNMQRHAVLGGIINQVKVVEARGYRVSIHLFAQNKSNTPEGIDWSYWASGNVLDGFGTVLFRQFVSDLQAAGGGLWLYDSLDP